MYILLHNNCYMHYTSQHIIYIILLYCRLRYVPSKTAPEDFTDSTYQTQLPPYARSTTSQVYHYYHYLY